MNLQPEDLQTLRLIATSGAVTIRELEATFPAEENFEARIGRLYSKWLVNGEHAPGKPTIYQITAKGRRAMLPRDGEYEGAIVGPAYKGDMRTSVYRGEKPIATRPGAMDAFSLPSRVGEKYTPHRLPLSIAAGDGQPGEVDE